jgi:hypothetical protein
MVGAESVSFSYTVPAPELQCGSGSEFGLQVRNDNTDPKVYAQTSIDDPVIHRLYPPSENLH